MLWIIVWVGCLAELLVACVYLLRTCACGFMVLGYLDCVVWVVMCTPFC